ncbi:response regulator [Cohnella nanjingensis]|uniref:Response regulator n=1 Tax=Cohnella nanjingensis TaxID=1387779 RepID=A0A7X0VE55_9BACL|nr:response regulator [Cohnella nanjingensis]MBB6670645.1 response regulator [Cohnella nanjingensis]
MNILLVDDEPIFMDKIKRIIADFSLESGIEAHVTTEAYNGQEALRAIAHQPPDIVFTDIRMSNMDGIELSKALHKEWPGIAVVIISGYPSFDYAREAMRANVVDYLLKPIDPELVKAILYQVQPKIRSSKYLHGKKLIQSLIESDVPNGVEDPFDFREMNAYASYCAFVVQNPETLYGKDGLFLQPSDHLHEGFAEQLPRLASELGSHWIFNSKDGRSFIVVAGLHRYEKKSVRLIAEATRDYFSLSGISVSVACSLEVKSLTEMREVVGRLHQLLDNKIVIGRSQILMMQEEISETKPAYFQMTSLLESKMRSWVTKKDWLSLKKEYYRLFQVWEAEQCPSIEIETNLKRIIHLMERHLQTFDAMASKKLEKRIEEIIFTAASYEEAAGFCWEVMGELLRFESREIYLDHSESTYKRIQAYMIAHLSDPISLSQLGDLFNVSRTYLCNLFRNYADASFVEYFTELRMERAKELMRSHPDIILKDIAELVGYADHHYFSRVFKTSCGITPSEYKQSLLNK